MSRVSTTGNYQSALLNLMSAQAQQNEAQTRLSTQKIATDMKGFGRGAESLTALKAAQNRVQGFIDTGTAVADRLESQDLALNQVGDGVTAARAAIGSALATENINTLMLELQGQFQSIQNGLNAQHQGNYLFAGLRYVQGAGHRVDHGRTGRRAQRRLDLHQRQPAPDLASGRADHGAHRLSGQ
jgi:flagellar hook-associated protein 3 FlgL